LIKWLIGYGRCLILNLNEVKIMIKLPSFKIVVATFILLSLMCGSACMRAVSQFEGQTVFNRVGLRPFKKNIISFTSYYHKGALIPAGTECKIKRISGGKIIFIAKGKKYKLKDWLISRGGENVKLSFDKFFTENHDEIGFSKINPVFYDSVMSGIDEVGMTKEEILICLGYPAYLGIKDATKDDGREYILSLNEWHYMSNRFNRLLFLFKAGKLHEILN
jgi:hypothetical protein